MRPEPTFAKKRWRPVLPWLPPNWPSTVDRSARQALCCSGAAVSLWICPEEGSSPIFQSQSMDSTKFPCVAGNENRING
jgi:hypothetical protein